MRRTAPILLVVLLPIVGCDDSRGVSGPADGSAGDGGADARPGSDVARADARDSNSTRRDAAADGGVPVDVDGPERDATRDGVTGDVPRRPDSGGDAVAPDVSPDAVDRDAGTDTDAAPADGSTLADAPEPDDTAADSSLVDAVGVDAREPDAGLVDVPVPDATPADARRVDVASPDVRQPDADRPDVVVDAQADAALDAGAEDAGEPDGCVGIVLPPPPESPDGEEVCNYVDDNGDGLVDEGFQYEFLGEPVRIVEEPEMGPEEFHIAWAGDGYGVSWTSGGGLSNFVKVDERGCPVGEHHEWPVDVERLIQNGIVQPFSEGMATAGDRFAVVWTTRRPPPEGAEWGSFATYVWLFDRDGAPLDDPIDFDPRRIHAPPNAITAMGDHFGVFSVAFDPETRRAGIGSFAVLDQDGQAVEGPMVVFNEDPDNSPAMQSLVGMAYDGEGLGLAYYSGSLPWPGIYFMRFAPDGRILTPPVPLGGGARLPNAGIAWTGEHFAIPADTGDQSWLLLVTPEGESLEPVLVHEVQPPFLAAYWFQLAWSNVHLLGYGAFSHAGTTLRIDVEGRALGPGTAGPPDVEALDSLRAGAIGIAHTARGGPFPDDRYPVFAYIGCPSEE